MLVSAVALCCGQSGLFSGFCDDLRPVRATKDATKPRKNWTHSLPDSIALGIN